jgi:DNA repair protein RadC
MTETMARMGLPPGGLMMAEMSDQERPRERLARLGAEALKDSELLAILLRTGCRGQSALGLAEQLLLTHDNSLVRLASAEIGELASIPGLGRVKAVELKAAFTLARRLGEQAQWRQNPCVSGPEDVMGLFRDRVRLMSQEEFRVLLLDTKNHLIAEHLVTKGLVDRSLVHPREVFRRAIRESCNRLILVHNHPSGDPTPSEHDIQSTRMLVEASRVVGIEIVDHIVVGFPAPGRLREYVSFRELGLMKIEP